MAAPRAAVEVREEVQREFEQWFGELKLRIGRKAHKRLPPSLILRTAAGAVEEVVDVFSVLFREEESRRIGIEAAEGSWLEHVMRSLSATAGQGSSSGAASRAQSVVGAHVVASVVETERRMRAGIESSEAHWRQLVLGRHPSRDRHEPPSSCRLAEGLRALVAVEEASRRDIEGSAERWRIQQKAEWDLRPAAPKTCQGLTTLTIAVTLCSEEERCRCKIITACEHQFAFILDSANHSAASVSLKKRACDVVAGFLAQACASLQDSEQTERSRIMSAHTAAMNEARLLWDISAARGAELMMAEQRENVCLCDALAKRIDELLQTETRWRSKIDRSFTRWVGMTLDALEVSKSKLHERLSSDANTVRVIDEKIAATIDLESRDRSQLQAGVEDWLKYCAEQFVHEGRQVQARLAERALLQRVPTSVPERSWIDELRREEHESRTQIITGEESWRAQIKSHRSAVLAAAVDPLLGSRMKDLCEREDLERLQIGVSEGKWRSHVLDRLEVGLQRCREKEAKNRPGSNSRRQQNSPYIGGFRLTDPF